MNESVDPTLDLDVLNRWRGRRRETVDRIRAQPAAFMRATLDAPWPGGHLQTGEPLPCAWHWLYFLDAKPLGELGRDGHPLRGDFLPPVKLPRRMWAGGRLELFESICIGDTIRRESTVADIARKTGRSGELCFVTVRHEFFRDSTLKMTEEHDIVYREAPAPGDRGDRDDGDRDDGDRGGDASAAPADATVRITPTPVMLFRYSALTFNSHRIHYDADYCRAVEGFPGPVVHGSLTATFLAGLAAQHCGRRALRRFAYRAVSPLYADSPFDISVRQHAGGLRLWAAGARGQLAMTADAELAELA